MVEADFSGLGSGSLGADISKYTRLCALKSVHFFVYDLYPSLKGTVGGWGMAESTVV